MDDLLLTEFHEADIYLPEELKAIEEAEKRAAQQSRMFAEQMEQMRRMQGMSLEACFAHGASMGYLSRQFQGQNLARQQRGPPFNCGNLLENLFGGRFL